MSIQRLKPTIINPSLRNLYKRYDEITENHCKFLLNHLYKFNQIFWINPLTRKEIHRDSIIIISFLSKCYYVWGENEVILNGEKLKYKEHVLKFIDRDYLIDVSSLKKSNA